MTWAGVLQHGADLAQSTGINGAGVKVCVLSDSADPGVISGLQASGDLPPVVDVLENAPGNSNEGAAMMEIVYDMVPGAALGFATAFISDVDFASNIVALQASPHNCNIIVDDVSYDGEGAFQDSVIAKAVNTVTAAGALYFSSAANSGNLASGTPGTWEGRFRRWRAQRPAAGGKPAQLRRERVRRAGRSWLRSYLAMVRSAGCVEQRL